MVHFELPGVDPASIDVDVDVERIVLTVHAKHKHRWARTSSCWPTSASTGSFGRQLFLGEALDTDEVDASAPQDSRLRRRPVGPRPSTPDRHLGGRNGR